MTGDEHQEQDVGRSRVSIWRTARGEPRWKITAVAGHDEAELERALAAALRVDRRLAQAFGLEPVADEERPFVGEEPAEEPLPWVGEEPE